jgi:hypothetical protein
MASVQQMNGNEKMAPPIETKVNMDKDYDYYIAKYNSNPPPPPPRNSKYQGNLGAVPMEPVSEQRPMGTPPRHPDVTPSTSPPGEKDAKESASPAADEEQVDGDDALLDLVQLEELHHEAERMKALGNKHMAAQVSDGVISVFLWYPAAHLLLFLIIRNILVPTTHIPLRFNFLL